MFGGRRRRKGREGRREARDGRKEGWMKGWIEGRMEGRMEEAELMKESRLILQHQHKENRNCPDKDQSENTP